MQKRKRVLLVALAVLGTAAIAVNSFLFLF
jgi:hypothetical protein